MPSSPLTLITPPLLPEGEGVVCAGGKVKGIPSPFGRGDYRGEG